MAPNPFVDEALGELRRGGFAPSAMRAFATRIWRRAMENAAGRPAVVRELRVTRRAGLVVALGLGAWAAHEGVPPLVSVLLPAATWLLLCGWTWAELGLLRDPLTGDPTAHLGPANILTLFRGWASALVLLLGLSRPAPTVEWVTLCLAAGLTDLVDGTIAARLRQESRLGRLLDPVMDACFFSAAAISLARWTLLPSWLAVLVAVRYFAPVLGGLVLLFAMGRSLPVRHTPWGQRSTAAIAAALVATWIGGYVSLPAPVLPVLYLVAACCMALALAGILRRAPRAA